MSSTPRTPAATLGAPPIPRAPAVALFLDVDGTLLDLADAPGAVQVEAALRQNLERVGQRLDGAVALLSGRPLAELDALFEWHARPAAGLHGGELRTPDGHTQFAGNATVFAGVRAYAASLLERTHGVILEDKQRALALHYRRAPAARGMAEQIADELLERAGTDYVLQRGDHVIELKPAGVDKGRALAGLMRTPPFSGRTPWMLGDDLTDEDAFAQVNRMGGTSIIVGARRPSVAGYALASPAATRAWLGKLAAA